MIIQKRSLITVFLLYAWQSACSTPLAEQFKQAGYIEVSEIQQPSVSFDDLYATFDALVEFLATHQRWEQKLNYAKERFIRSKEKHYYSTDFFGFYKELANKDVRQISFYYGAHFHEFIRTHFTELTQVPEISNFLDACFEIQKPCTPVFQKVATELGVEDIFSSLNGQPPILLKVVKYFPAYAPSRPHFDGTAFSMFLHSTRQESLLLSVYKDPITVGDFHIPERTISPTSALIIPGALLAEFSIYPTPHIVVQKGITRYSTIAFALRPHYTPPKPNFCTLPSFNP